MKVLVTRPIESSLELKAMLEARRHDVTLAPVLSIEPLQFSLPDVDAGAFAITSANAIPALAAVAPSKGIPVFAVGQASAAAAREWGFTNVHAADGDVRGLGELIQGTHPPDAGSVVHLAGEHVAGNLTGTLSAAGYRAEVVAVYRAMAVEKLPPAAEVAFREENIDAALFFSPRSARTLLSLLKASNQAGHVMRTLKDVQAIAISKAVAIELEPELWRAVHIAPDKSAEGVLAALDALMKDEG